MLKSVVYNVWGFITVPNTLYSTSSFSVYFNIYVKFNFFYFLMCLIIYKKKEIYILFLYKSFMKL